MNFYLPGFTDLKADADRSVRTISDSDLASEMLSSIGNADDFLDDLPSQMELDSSFNEVFTDLSEFITQVIIVIRWVVKMLEVEHIKKNKLAVVTWTNKTECFPFQEGLASIDLDGATPTTASLMETEVKLDMNVSIVKKTNKRKADVTPAASDHSGYATKKARVESLVVIDKPESDTTVTHTKEEKYRERRRKNNLASKRSRETRKLKFGDMECTARQLEVENDALRTKVEELEMLTKKMKDILVQKLARQ